MRSFADIIKDSPSVGDVHIASTSRRRRRRSVPIALIGDTATKVPSETTSKADDATLSFYVPISKVNDELRTVYGWATVNSEGGRLVTDHQDDQVEDAEMTKAAHDFVAQSREGGVLHALRADGTPHSGGDVVESIVLTADVQKALGVDLGKTGWFIGYRVNDPDAWDLVKRGVLKGFSIGGKARRVPVGA
jgi:hypothetical protein